MQVLDKKLSQFRDRVLEDYKKNDAYLTLRKSKKYGDRQKVMSVAVLEYILDHGIWPVRRCELRRVFMARDALNKRADPLKDRRLQGIREDLIKAGSEWHEETDSLTKSGRLTKSEFRLIRSSLIEIDDRLYKRTALTDREIQRILDNLIAAGFIQRDEEHPLSNRTRGRKKPDVYYHTNLSRVNWLEEVCGGNQDEYDRVWKKLTFDDSESFHKHPIILARMELRAMDLRKTSDKELATWFLLTAQAIVSAEDEQDDDLRNGLSDYIEKKFKDVCYPTFN